MTPGQHSKNVRDCADIILKKNSGKKPRLAIILGSGLGGLGDRVENPLRIPYADLPGFPILSVAGHAGEIIAGTLNGTEVLVFKGRKHFYETDDAYSLKTMIRTAKTAGADILFVSNAAGSVRAHIPVAGLMMMTDHINYMGLNPLTGPNDDDFGPRFSAMGDAYDTDLQKKMRLSAEKSGVTLHSGVYMAFRGPSFETPAEIRMTQAMGADAVGMSSVPDAIIARHCGLRVAGCSCITNMGAGMSDEHLSHSHTLENAARASRDFEKMVMAFAGMV